MLKRCEDFKTGIKKIGEQVKTGNSRLYDVAFINANPWPTPRSVDSLYEDHSEKVLKKIQI